MPYNHLLVSQMKQCSTSEENAKLHSRVTVGDEAAKQRMIEGNMPLVVNKVEALVAKAPALAYLYDDMLSAGLLRLVEAVDSIANLPADDSDMVAGYLAKAITNAIADEIESSSTIHVARRSLKRLKSKGDCPPVATTLEHDPIQEVSAAHRVFEMRDLVMSCCKSEHERAVVTLREAGYTCEEIGAQLSISKPTVTRYLRQIAARYDAKQRTLS